MADPTTHNGPGHRLKEVLVRTNVRDTSLEGYEEMRPKPGNNQTIVYSLLAQKGSLNDKKIAVTLGWEINCVTGQTKTERVSRIAGLSSGFMGPSWPAGDGLVWFHSPAGTFLGTFRSMKIRPDPVEGAVRSNTPRGGSEEVWAVAMLPAGTVVGTLPGIP